MESLNLSFSSASGIKLDLRRFDMFMTLAVYQQRDGKKFENK